jgi:hypothetical protein
VSFSTDELVALARRLELPPLPALGPDPLDDLDPATRERVLDAADRSLVARNVIDSDGGSVLPVIASLLVRSCWRGSDGGRATRPRRRTSPPGRT